MLGQQQVRSTGGQQRRAEGGTAELGCGRLGMGPDLSEEHLHACQLALSMVVLSQQLIRPRSDLDRPDKARESNRRGQGDDRGELNREGPPIDVHA